MTRTELLALISDKKIFSIKFRKRTDGSIREMNCMLGVTKHLKGGTKAFDDSDKNIITVFDLQKSAYRSINCDSILEVKAGGVVHV